MINIKKLLRAILFSIPASIAMIIAIIKISQSVAAKKPATADVTDVAMYVGSVVSLLATIIIEYVKSIKSEKEIEKKLNDVNTTKNWLQLIQTASNAIDKAKCDIVNHIYNDHKHGKKYIVFSKPKEHLVAIITSVKNILRDLGCLETTEPILYFRSNGEQWKTINSLVADNYVETNLEKLRDNTLKYTLNATSNSFILYFDPHADRTLKLPCEISIETAYSEQIDPEILYNSIVFFKYRIYYEVYLLFLQRQCESDIPSTNIQIDKSNILNFGDTTGTGKRKTRK